MTDYADTVRRLRDAGVLVSCGCGPLMHEAADAIESLRAKCGRWKVRAGRCGSDKGALKARLAEVERERERRANEYAKTCGRLGGRLAEVERALRGLADETEASSDFHDLRAKIRVLAASGETPPCPKCDGAPSFVQAECEECGGRAASGETPGPQERQKAPCLYPLADGRRCCECATCHPDTDTAAGLSDGSRTLGSSA